MSLFTDSLSKETCVLCNKVVSAVGGGHWVNNPVYEGENFVESKSEFHCMICDPIVIKEDEPTTDYNTGGGN